MGKLLMNEPEIIKAIEFAREVGDFIKHQHSLEMRKRSKMKRPFKGLLQNHMHTLTLLVYLYFYIHSHSHYPNVFHPVQFYLSQDK